MGTHPSGPSKIANSQQRLLDWIKDHNDSVGIVPAGYTSDDLPFLFKVLSVRTALSIQAHPDKDLAKELFAQFPEVYKDGNHKPEMAVALTDFECMCGFRSPSELVQNGVVFPELNAIISAGGFDMSQLSNLDGNTKVKLRAMFEAYMSCPEEVGLKYLREMISRLESVASPTALEQLLLRLHSQYPGDRGVFGPCLLNYLTLNRGESFFIGANEPHAYISGDLMECMALSDNVVRAGLTPKFKDVKTLVNMLHYNHGTPSMLTPIPLDSFTSVYRPPLDSCAEFEVEVTTIPANTAEYTLITGNYASILIAVEGAGSTFKSDQTSLTVGMGSVLFVAANTAVTVSTSDCSLQFYRAHVNLSAN